MAPNDKKSDLRSDTVQRALVRAFALFRRAMAPYFASFGISGSQWGVLRTLQRARDEGLEGLRLTEISGRLLIQPPSVTGVVDRLRRLGLVTRSVSAADQRVREVRLTEAGLRLIARVRKRHRTQLRRVFAGLETREELELHRLLDRLSLHIESMLERLERSDGTGRARPPLERLREASS